MASRQEAESLNSAPDLAPKPRLSELPNPRLLDPNPQNHIFCILLLAMLIGELFAITSPVGHAPAPAASTS